MVSARATQRSLHASNAVVLHTDRTYSYAKILPTPLLRVSRQVRKEALSIFYNREPPPLFYSASTFQIYCRPGMSKTSPGDPELSYQHLKHYPINHHLIQHLRIDSYGPWLEMSDRPRNQSLNLHQSMDADAIQYLADVGCRLKTLKIAIMVVGANRAPWYLSKDSVYRGRMEKAMLALEVTEHVAFRVCTPLDQEVTIDAMVGRVAERKGMQGTPTRFAKAGPSEVPRPGDWIGNKWECVLRPG